MTEDMGLALQNHQLEAENERLTGQNAALREVNHQLDQRCVDLYRQLTQITAERDTLVADVRQRQQGQKSAEEQLQQVSTHRDHLLAALHEATNERVAVQEENKKLRADAEHFAELGQASDMSAATIMEENAAMRALLEQVVNFDPEWIVDGNPCLFCDANAPGGEVIHAQDCLIVQARALLAK